MAIGTTDDKDAAPQLTTLNGVRFLAVFHIFLFHLWSTRNEGDIGSVLGGRFANIYAPLDRLPRWLDNFLAHGYLSTSFFFLLSGFILAYLYWSPGGGLSTSKRRFWWARLSRIYPAHFVALGISILLMLPRFVFDPSAPSLPLAAASAVTTATLTQAWFPPLVPIFNWPTWALSALVFLYLMMPWLMGWLARLRRTQMIALLAAMPVVSLVPTLVYLCFFPDGAADSRNWRTFIGSTPLFWLPYFAAGMLLSRICGISRFERRWRERPARWLAVGDLAFVALLAIYFTEPQSFAWRFVLRHGLLLPLHLLVLYDFALGRGCFARLFSLPGMNAVGQLSFSIFIWQSFLLAISFMVLYANPAAGAATLWVAIVGVLLVSAMSTHLLEKPLAKRLRRRFAAPEAMRTL